MYELRWAISVVAAVVSVLVIIGNPVIGFLIQRRGGHYSAVPMVGGLAGVVACVAMPVDGSAKWFFVPLILDYTYLGLVYVLISELRAKP